MPRQYGTSRIGNEGEKSLKKANELSIKGSKKIRLIQILMIGTTIHSWTTEAIRRIFVFFDFRIVITNSTPIYQCSI